MDIPDHNKTTKRGQAEAVEGGATRAEVVEALGAESLDEGNTPLSDVDASVVDLVERCIYYALEDTEDAVWEFCFADGTLLVTARAEL